MIGEHLAIEDCDLTSRYIKENNYEAINVQFEWATTEYEYSLEREYTNFSAKRMMSKVEVRKRWFIGEPYAVVLQFIQPSTAPGDVYRLTFNLIDSTVSSVEFAHYKGIEWYTVRDITCSNERNLLL